MSFESVELHTALQAVAALIALGISRLLIVSERRGGGTSFNRRLSCAFVVIGIVYSLDAVIRVDKSFVMLQSGVNFTGGLLLASIWLPREWLPTSFRRYPLVIGATLLIIMATSSLISGRPLQFPDGRLAETVKWLSTAGGVLMLLAGVRLFRSFRKHNLTPDLVFGLLCGVLSAAAVLFVFSRPWSIAWWAWHVLPALSYGAALCFLSMTDDRVLPRFIRGIRDDSERRHQELFDSSGDALIILQDQRIIDCNQATLRLFGYAGKQDLCGRGLADLSPVNQPGGDGSASLIEAQANAALAHGVAQFEWVHQRQDGTQFCADVALSRLRSSRLPILLAAIRNTTRLKLVERELRQALQTTDAILESTSEGVIAIDEHGTIVLANLAVAKMFGYPAEYLQNRNVSILMPPPHQEQHDGYISHYLRTGEPSLIGVPRELVALRSNATTFPVELTIAEVATETGRLFVGTVRDLTERKRSLSSLRLMRTAIDSASEGMFTLGRDGRILDVNQAACLRLGYSRGELLSLSAWDISARCTKETWPQFWEQLKYNQRTVYETQHRARNGRELPVEISNVFMEFDGGEFVCDFVRDISERKNSQKALRDSDNRFRQLATQIHDVLWLTSADGQTVIYVNQAYESIWGNSVESLYRSARSWIESIHVDDRERVTRALDECLANGGYDETFRVVRPDASVLWVHATGLPIYDELGDVYRVGGVMRDITERKKYETALIEARRAAESANNAKTEFLTHMSHEIRTPLNSILGFTEVLRRGVGSDEQRTGHLQTIHSSGRHLLSLIDDILDLSKIEAGQMEFERVHCSPHQIISDVLSLLRVRALEKCLTLDARWSSGVPGTIQTDPARFRQLLMNVVGNAVKFTEHGGVFLTITVAPDAPEPRFVIEIKDTGIGIPPDRLESIFSPFTQADNSITRRFGGTGLGMAISRHMARGLGGDIIVESELGKGSVFRITLETGPLDGVPIHDSPPSDAFRSCHESVRTEVTELPHPKILIVEDGDTNRELIELLLRDAGADVVCAENGKQALEAVEQMQFDLILMDLQMPVMDGRTAARQLRQDGFTGPIIALTAHAMRGVREECLGAGFSGYLSKPIDVDDLLATVADALRTSPIDPSATADNAEDAASPLAPPDTGLPITSTLVLGRPECRPIVERFIAKLPGRLDELDKALQAEDLETVRELAHWLKGSGGTLGFDCFTEPARRVEQLASQHQHNGLKLGIQELKDLAQRITVATAN